MMWFFERSKESLQVETRYDNDGAAFVATIRYPEGRTQTERFTKATEMKAWLLAFEQTLENHQWRLQGGGPFILPDGWPDDRLP